MTSDIGKLQQSAIVDQDGSKIGSVGQVYVDDRTSQPTFATVKTGLFGSKETFVPLSKAKETADGLSVPYTKDFVKDAPNLDADEHLSERQQDEIYSYYKLDGAPGSNGDSDARQRGDGTAAGAGAGGAAAGGVAAGGAAGAAGAGDAAPGRTADTAGAPNAAGTGAAGAPTAGGTDRTSAAGAQATGAQAASGQADESVTLREERLNVGTERVESGRVRIRKYVVTDQETVTVPVEREEYEVVREPIADGEHGGSLGEDSAEVRLTEERPVVDKEVVDAERVGLKTHTVTDEQQVQAKVGHEEFEVDDAASKTDHNKQ